MTNAQVAAENGSAKAATPDAFLPEVELVKISEIDMTGDRMREVDDRQVANLEVSIRSVGVLQPVLVRPSEGDSDLPYVVVFGKHRILACENLGWETIPASIRDISYEEARLMEIDENLERMDLTPSQESAHLAERKRLVTALNKHAGKGGRGVKGFAQQTSERTGQSKTSINNKVRRAMAIGVGNMTAIAGTSLDTHEELEALSRLVKAEREGIIGRVLAGSKESAKARLQQLERDKKAKERDGKKGAEPAAKEAPADETSTAEAAEDTQPAAKAPPQTRVNDTPEITEAEKIAVRARETIEAFTKMTDAKIVRANVNDDDLESFRGLIKDARDCVYELIVEFDIVD